MRYPASEKLEIIRLVEQSHLPARRTLEQLGIPRRTFCRWYARYLDGGPEVSPRELAVRFTDEKRYFVSEGLPPAEGHDLITSPAYVVIKAADAFHTKTT